MKAYDLNKLKFATDEATFMRAVGLYESGKVGHVEELGKTAKNRDRHYLLTVDPELSRIYTCQEQPE